MGTLGRRWGFAPNPTKNLRFLDFPYLKGLVRMLPYKALLCFYVKDTSCKREAKKGV